MCRWEEGEGVVVASSSKSIANTNTPKLGKRRGVFPLQSPKSPLSAAAVFFCDAGRGEEEGGHFLDSCFLCKRPLGSGRDIFMYRGDKPFCSEECREEQMERDEEVEERRRRKKKGARRWGSEARKF